MQRDVVAAAQLTGAPLNEFKHWLSISTAFEDAYLESLLRSALVMCETFTELMPIMQICEEVLPASTDWLNLRTRPVGSLLDLRAIDISGTRLPIASEDREVRLDADGILRLRLARLPGPDRIIVRFSAGMADDWSALDSPLKQGILRYAGHLYRERDGSGEAIPPAAVAALWRPYRRLRLT